mgnify:CR=1 FL=1
MNFDELIQKEEEALLRDLRELVRIPSVSVPGTGRAPYGAECRRALDWFLSRASEMGFQTRDVDGHCGWCEYGEGEEMVAVLCHLDVVPAGDGWHYPPYDCTWAEGRIYGRGTSDMKGSVTAMISAVAHFAEDSGRDFAGEICVSCTVHEECFEGVSSREITRLAKPDFVIIGEATSTTVKIGQRGRAEVVVETEGVSCHSSNPDKGVNAVYHMMAVIEEIRRIIPNEHPILGKGILELTDIISSPYPGASVVPALCRATFDRRTLTGENEAVILGQVEEAIARAREKIPGLKARTYLAEGKEVCWTGEAIAAKRYFPAWLIDEDNEYVQKALAGLKKAGIEAPISHFSFCTNGSHFCGEAGIPCIGYGPSLESLAHVRDEYIEIEQLTKACRGFASILRELTQ